MSAATLSVVGRVEVRPCPFCCLFVSHRQHTFYARRTRGFEVANLWEPAAHEAPCGRLCCASPPETRHSVGQLHRAGCEECAVDSRWLGGAT